jgi:hypothetical protein
MLQVTNYAFSYAMPHPHAPDNPTQVYRATIASDGTFSATLHSGEMNGRIVGGHMSGTINGSLCVYSFSMDRS